MTFDLKKQVRAIDLALASARKRQSAKTGFIHLFPHEEGVWDTIPLYENFCFVFALFRQKSAETVLEAKALLERLLAFQTLDGNFPVYLHEFPKNRDSYLPLRITPLLLQLERHFSSILGSELKLKIQQAAQNSLRSIEKVRLEKPLPLLWENRYRACVQEPLLPVVGENFSPLEWGEWVITLQLADRLDLLGPIPFYRSLQLLLASPSSEIQERLEPQPAPLEWVLAEAEEAYTSRLLHDHPYQILAAPLFALDIKGIEGISILQLEKRMRFFWKGNTIHSLLSTAATALAKTAQGAVLLFDLPHPMEQKRDDLFEVSFYCDASKETHLFVQDQKATVFHLEEEIRIETPTQAITLYFELVEGEGDFLGHFARGNRPTQSACKGSLQYEAFDWHIGLRTLRRSASCKIQVTITTREKPFLD